MMHKKILTILCLSILGISAQAQTSAPFQINKSQAVQPSIPPVSIPPSANLTPPQNIAPIGNANDSQTKESSVKVKRVKKVDAEEDIEADVTKVNKNTAIKDKLRSQVVLPGIKKIDGNDPLALDFTRAQILSLNELGSKTAYIAMGQLNRVELPFPVNYSNFMWDQSKIKVDKSDTKVANSIYVTSLDYSSTTLYVEAPDGKALAINFSPKKDVPAQTIIVRNITENLGFGDKAMQPDGSSSEAKMITALTVAAGGKTPQGFSDSEFSNGLYIKNELTIRPVRVLTNANVDIFDYEITNKKNLPIKVEEEDLDLRSAQAYTFFPSDVIEPGKSVHAFILIKRY